MPEEQLDSLLERIQRDGVEKARKEADAIIANAEERARKVVAAAEKDAKALLDDAHTEAASVQQRSEAALRNAARDVRLSVEKAVTSAFFRLLKIETSKTFSAETLAPLVRDVVMAYAANTDAGSDLTVLLSDEQCHDVKEKLLALLKDGLKKGLAVQSDEKLGAGFKIKLTADNVEHDFSADAIVEALSRFLRPDLVRLLRDDDKENSDSNG